MSDLESDALTLRYPCGHTTQSKLEAAKTERFHLLTGLRSTTGLRRIDIDFPTNFFIESIESHIQPQKNSRVGKRKRRRLYRHGPHWLVPEKVNICWKPRWDSWCYRWTIRPTKIDQNLCGKLGPMPTLRVPFTSPSPHRRPTINGGKSWRRFGRVSRILLSCTNNLHRVRWDRMMTIMR